MNMLSWLLESNRHLVAKQICLLEKTTELKIQTLNTIRETQGISEQKTNITVLIFHLLSTEI